MFQRRSQSSYSGVDSTGEQHILTVLRFHEVRLGKIEKHLINTNKQLELLTKQQQPTKFNTRTKSTNNADSFTLLKNMMTNLTEQVEVSQSFMKEIKEVISNLKLNQVKEVEVEVEKKESSVELNSSSSEDDTNSKLLELEKNIAKASIISIGMEPTINRINEYVERNRRERRRILSNLGKEEEVESEEEETKEEEEEINEEDRDMIDINHVTSHSIVDDAVLEKDIIKLTNFKSHIEEEVQDVIDKIPVLIKPKKKRRGRPKKT